MAETKPPFKYLRVQQHNGGISISEKLGGTGANYFAQKLNIYNEPTSVVVMPATVKISGSVITDTIKWIVSSAPWTTSKFAYGSSGNIYNIDASNNVTLLRSVTSSSGQGMAVWNNYLYYTQNTQLGRYGPLNSSPTFTDAYQTGLNDTSGSGWAPVMQFGDFVYVGHNNRLAQDDGTGSGFTVYMLTLPSGEYIRCLETIDEYLVLGTWRSSSQSVLESEQGGLYLWDGQTLDGSGTAGAYNYFLAVPEGGVNAILNTRNRLLISAGTAGVLFLKSTTYINYTPFSKAHQLPRLGLGNYVEMFPGAMCNWKGISYFAWSGNTDSTAIIQGVYSWGSKNDQFPEILNYPFAISTGTQTGTGMKVTAVEAVGNFLYIGWKDGSNFGIDMVTNGGAPFSSAQWESLIFDDGEIDQEDLATAIKVVHLPLRSNEGIQLGYKLNRAASYTLGTVNTVVGSTETRLPIELSQGRFNEFQWTYILSCGTTSPTVLSTAMEYNPLIEETRF